MGKAKVERLINLFMQPYSMNLVKIFLYKLEKQEQLKKRNMRLYNVETLLKKEIKKASSLTQYCIKNNINKGTLQYMLKGKRAIYLDLININKINKEKVRFLLKDSNIAIKIPVDITPELAYLIGMLRDGSINLESSNEYCCAFYSKYKKSLIVVRDYVTKVFGIKSKIEKNKDNLYMVRIRSKTLYMFFKLVFEVKPKQKNWDTPKLIKKSTKIIKKFYVRGFWDAEGGCPHLKINRKLIKKNLEVKFSQKNKESLEFIRDYLNSIGIKTGNVYFNKDVYVLKITQSYIPKFKNKIGSFHPVKAKRLESLAKLFAH